MGDVVKALLFRPPDVNPDQPLRLALVFALLAPLALWVGLHGADLDERLASYEGTLVLTCVVAGLFGYALPQLARRARTARVMGAIVLASALSMAFAAASSGPWSTECGASSWDGLAGRLARGALAGGALGCLLALFVRRLAALIKTDEADVQDRIAVRLSMAIGVLAALAAACSRTSPQPRVVLVVLSMLSVVPLLGIFSRDRDRLRQLARVHADCHPHLRLVPFDPAFEDLPRVAGATVGRLGVVHAPRSESDYRQPARRAVALSDRDAVSILRRRAAWHGLSQLATLSMLAALAAGMRFGGHDFRAPDNLSCCL